MMTEATRLESTLQAMVDDRLDAIDRVLLESGMSRSERRGIAEEVEAQIYELLGRRAAGEPTRADVLAVLESLDPPEAYAPEGHRAAWRRLDMPRRRVRQPWLLALGSAVAGSLVLLLGACGIAMCLEEALGLLLITGFILAAGSATSLCGMFAIRQIRDSDGWITGLPAAFFGAIIIPLAIANTLLLAAFLLFHGLGMYVLSAFAVIGGNAFLIFHAWRWISADSTADTACRHHPGPQNR